MKKKVIKFLIVIVLVVLLSSSGIYYLSKDDKVSDIKEEKVELAKLSGEVKNERTHLFVKKKTDDNYITLYAKDNKIYYLEDISNKAVLSYQDIYKKDIVEVGRIKNKYGSCSFEAYSLNIRCLDDDYIRYYDQDLKLISEYKTKEDTYLYVPYQDSFINADEIEDLNHDKLTYANYFYTKDNTYITYYRSGSDMILIYDVKNKISYNEYYTNHTFSENGVIIINKNEIISYDLTKDKVKKTKVKSITKNDIGGTYAVNKDGTIFGSFSDSKKILLQNFKDNTILELDASDIKYNYMSQMLIMDNFVILSDMNDKVNNIYVIEFTGLKWESMDDYKNKKSKEIETKIKKIKDEYNINVLVKEDTNVSFPDFQAEYSSDDNLIISYLDTILEVASRFNKEFFDQFYLDGLKGINIYLTGQLNPKSSFQYSSPAAYTLMFEDKYTMVFDVNQSLIEENICHEISHTIENNVNNNLKLKKGIYENWSKYNPKNYNYAYSYSDDFSYKYTIGNAKNSNVYFISSYSNSYPTEDKAELFSYICTYNKDLLKYDKLVKKAKYMKEEIIKFYPSLDGAKVFDIIK